ncbi:hypothetical protein [Nocardioides houyundeii]|uniref:hypothetical protein n=1 Tax=Nocardioides houyundeii TaxID=2045452 RepID=UPI001F072F70|nr:hypothetical protein [Nocardioides houyundeii]
MLQQKTLGLRGAQRLRAVRRTQPAPGHQVGVGCHRGRRVQLQQRQVAHHLDQVVGARLVQQLGLYRHPPGIGSGQEMRPLRHRRSA